MKSERDVADFLGQQAYIAALLQAASELVLPDSWIGAGLIRNAIWDCLHGFDAASSPIRDVDVIYFDLARQDAAHEAYLEAALGRAAPGIDWQVRNQARMHLRNGDPPYRETADALRNWPETATAIAARWHCERVEIIAPFGLNDLLGLIVRPTPRFIHRNATYQERLAAKNWQARWPRLTIL